jgi:hypothetical protein
MDCNELLRRQLANRLVCQSQQIAIGPTGGTGPLGLTGPTGPPASRSSITQYYTIFIDYSTQATINRVSIPAGLFTNPLLSAGGVFTANVGTDLIFLDPATGAGLDNITCANTTHEFVINIAASGYITSGQWVPIPGGNLGPTRTSYTVSADNSVQIKGLNLTNINGANISVRPTSGLAAGFLATITLFYYNI